MISIIKHRNIYFTISAILVTVSIAAMVAFGFHLAIDFTGGSLMQIRVADGVKTDASAIQTLLTTGDKKVLENATVQTTDNNGFILRFKDVSQDEHQAILSALRAKFAKDYPLLSKEGAGVVTEDQFESIGPTVGNELKQKSMYAILAVLAAIIIYIAYAFRKVSQPVASWKYGMAAIVALTHDVIIPTGIFAVLGHYWGVEIDILFITAILTMLGFSVHDTIVVFDRTRENLVRSRHLGSFEEIVNHSVNETIRRSINTSMTAFLALLAIYLFGGESVKHFVLALMLGIIFGTYSSIFIASPLLVVWNNWSRGRKK